jgi:hypothetical protein
MVTINGEIFHDKPGSCGTCPFFNSGNTYLSSRLGCNSSMGFCTVFGENHRSWINPPRRCQKLFNKAFRMPDGSDLVIVKNTED